MFKKGYIPTIEQKRIFPELKFDLSNVLSLCPNCHARKTKTDRKWITQVLKGRLGDQGSKLKNEA